MRKLAAFLDTVRPHVLGVCEIPAGDALSLATRFAYEWAYRGKQALFWSARFRAHAVHDRYLPSSAARLFDRRALLVVDGALEGAPCMLAATQLDGARESLIADLRFVRRYLRGSGPALLFAQLPDYRIGVSDLGFSRVADGIFERGFAPGALRAQTARV